jgi:N-acetyl-anhydromuramyl-L-alanine amidase AmpD
MAYQFVQAANHWNGREGQQPRYIIVHGTAGGSSALGIAQYFAKPSTQASTHYVIGQDGTVVQCVAESDAAWANGGISGPASSTPNRTGYGNGLHDAWWDNGINPNLVSIAIEHVKPHTDNSDQLTDAQKQASFNLIREICVRWSIPMRWADANGGITGHYSMDPVNRQYCPGLYPWNDLFSFLGANQDMPMDLTDAFAANWFKDVGNGRWQCKNGNVVGGAILLFYRQVWGAPRLPLSGEIKNIPNHPEVAIQVYESGVVCYDPRGVLDAPNGPRWFNCYMMHLDQAIQRGLVGAELKAQVDAANKALQQAVAAEQALQTQLNTLKASQPFDVDKVKADITNAQQALTDALAQVSK